MSGRDPEDGARPAPAGDPTDAGSAPTPRPPHLRPPRLSGFFIERRRPDPATLEHTHPEAGDDAAVDGRTALSGVVARADTPGITAALSGRIDGALALRVALRGRGHRFPRVPAGLDPSLDGAACAVHCYEERGIDAIADLSGPFALAIRDARFDLLILARGDVAAPPLLAAWSPRAFAFATEPLALRSLPRAGTEIDEEALRRFRSTPAMPPDTIVRGIAPLPSRVIWKCHRATAGPVVSSLHTPAAGARPIDPEFHEAWARETFRRTLHIAIEGGAPVALLTLGLPLEEDLATALEQGGVEATVLGPPITQPRSRLPFRPIDPTPDVLAAALEALSTAAPRPVIDPLAILAAVAADEAARAGNRTLLLAPPPPTLACDLGALALVALRAGTILTSPVSPTPPPGDGGVPAALRRGIPKRLAVSSSLPATWRDRALAAFLEAWGFTPRDRQPHPSHP